MKKIIITMLLGGVLLSCSKFEIKPKGQANIDQLTTKAGVNGLLVGAYACVDGTMVNDAVSAWAGSVSNWVWGSVASDDARKGSSMGDQSPINPIEYFYVDASNSYVNNRWRSYYEAVSRANEVLRALQSVTDMTDTEKVQVEAQAKFLRAHFYFYLTIVYGKVPYIDENTEAPGAVPNDHAVWAEMENDLKFAAANLPSSWSDKGRATSWAAKTYLAKVYMFQQKFTDALPLLQDVYDNGPFTLMDSYEKNYRIAYNNNAESIWEVQYAVNDGASGSPNANWGDGLVFPHGTAGLGIQGAFFQATHNFVSAFRVDNNGIPLLDDTYSVDDILPYSHTGAGVLYTQPVDPRLDHTVGRPGVPFLDFGVVHGGDSWVVDAVNMGPYNYKKNMFLASERSSTTTTGWMTGLNPNNFRVFKLGNVILWLAECEAEAGSLHNATTLVNLIRNRARQSDIVTFDDGTPAANYKVEPYASDFPSKEYARKAVRMEMRLEFGMEGMRFFDLVRWGIAAETINRYLEVEGTIMPPLTGMRFIAGQHEIWPIPQTQIDLSDKVNGESVLKQNPGY
ncbi:MAG: RagB/SusD family nutrient uptake outer membrane protein [Chitinophagaceae bacterium]|nr:RagB/SusD family nutrient uptake outer membrane protein [Chitinophagaceae bacterium]